MKYSFPAVTAYLAILLFLAPATYSQEAPGKKIIIAENGKSVYRIVVSRDASPSERHAADELQKFLAEISGATLPIVDDATEFSQKEIILGNTVHLKQANIDIDFAKIDGNLE